MLKVDGTALAGNIRRHKVLMTADYTLNDTKLEIKRITGLTRNAHGDGTLESFVRLMRGDYT